MCAHILVAVFVYIYVYVYMETNVDAGSLSQSFSTLFIKAGSLSWIQSSPIMLVYSLLWESPVSTFQVLELQSGHHAYAAAARVLGV